MTARAVATGGGTPGGVDTSVQFNNAGVFDGFGTWDGSVLAVPGDIQLADGDAIELGNAQDLILEHTGAISQIISNQGNFIIRQNVTGGSGFIQSRNGGLVDNIIWGGATPNVRLFQAGSEVARTVAAASGGLEANNTATGAGFERVLTTSDIVAPGDLQDAYDAAPTAAPHILTQDAANPLRFQAPVTGPVLQVRDTVGANILEVDDTFVEVDGLLRVQDAFTNHASPNSIIVDDTFSSGGAFIGASILSSGTLTATVSSTWIWSLVQDAKTYQMGVNPAFAAWALFNVLCTIENSGNFNLVQAVVLNNGAKHRRTTAGTSTVVANTCISNSPNMHAQVAGAILTKTNGDIGISHRPTFITVGGSTINGGTSTGLLYQQPAVALFGTSAGTENYTAFIAVDVLAQPGFGNIVKNAVRSNLANATNTRVINGLGTAQSDLRGNLNFPADLVGNTFGASQDWSHGWAGAGFFFEQQITGAGGQMRRSFPAVGRMLMDWAVDTELTINSVEGFSIGAQAGANGNQFGNFVTGSGGSFLTPAIGGDFSGFLLTHSQNFFNNGAARGRVSAWVLNGFSYQNSTGSVAEADTLTLGGFPTSSPGVTITERQSLNVIGGRSKLSCSMQYPPISPTALGSGNNNDWAGLLTGSANNSMRHWARISGNVTTSVLTGIDATSVQDGDTFELTNVGANAIDITHQDAASVAANRVISPTGATYVLAADETVLIRYDLTTARFRLLAGTGA